MKPQHFMRVTWILREYEKMNQIDRLFFCFLVPNPGEDCAEQGFPSSPTAPDGS